MGRSSFELARTFDEVIGIDFSARFIAAAQTMQRERSMNLQAPREGIALDDFHVALPDDIPRDRVRFEQGDACTLRRGLGIFDLVLMANLIDRLPDPLRCLAQLPALVAPGGALIITSPYTWLEEYTPRDRWLDQGAGTLATLQEKLAPAFTCSRTTSTCGSAPKTCVTVVRSARAPPRRGSHASEASDAIAATDSSISGPLTRASSVWNSGGYLRATVGDIERNARALEDRISILLV